MPKSQNVEEAIDEHVVVEGLEGRAEYEDSPWMEMGGTTKRIRLKTSCKTLAIYYLYIHKARSPQEERKKTVLSFFLSLSLISSLTYLYTYTDCGFLFRNLPYIHT